MKIEFNKGELEIEGVGISHAEIGSITFKNFLSLSDRIASVESDAREAALTRLRMIEQVKLYTSDGGAIVLDDVKVLNLPIKVGLKLVRGLNASSVEPGKVINDGDGIEKPLLFKLGAPIKTKEGVIEELEFMAKTFGDVEDIVSEPSAFKRGYMLIQKASKPIATGYKLLRTSEAIAEKIVFEDGLAISIEVAPLFFD